MSKKELRQGRILDYLEINECLSVEDMAKEFSLTEATIRRDLDSLEKKERIIRTHGGARVVEENPKIAQSFGNRRNRMFKEKISIVKKVASLIPNDTVITLDNGTTAWLLAKELKKKKKITVVTNSILIMEEFYEADNIKLLLAGGEFRKRNYDFVGEKTISFFKQIYSDISILTCDSFKPEFGFYKLSNPSADIAKVAVDYSNKAFVIADHTKVEAQGAYRFSTDSQVDTFFTDSNIGQADIEKIKNANCDVSYC